ncbi:AAA family ATPase [Cellulomonas sp. APG4]|uniref:AAA family ATPase n=1 Tax=Cellulomonas sp. APG4 TaxID=1538656 RepID=UPI0013794F81|nr:AAA family ATPase [Cellulomonas sp. APG4]NCT90154.1 AAA family ATPase [Cellulomonas sp. APG4]
MSGEILNRIRTGDWLDAQSFPPLSWAVPGIVPEGFGLFTGPPKAGKSWATLGIVLAVAAGGRAFGKVPVGEARPVLLLALEDGDRRLQDRCRRLLGEEPIPTGLHYTTRATPADVLDLTRAWLEQHGDRRPLVVLDTLGKVTPPSLPGESAYARDYRIGGHLKALSDDHPGTTLLVVHHVRKAASEDWMDSTSGTNGLNGAADFTVSLSRPRNEADGVLRVTGRDVPECEYAITVADGAWTLRGSSLADAARAAQQTKVTEGLGDTSARVVAHVTERPEGVRAKEVADTLSLTEKDAGTYLLRAERAGRIVRLGRGLYGPLSTPVGTVGSVGTSYTSDASYTTCRGCGEQLDPWLVDSGETAHVGCEVAA